MERSNSSFRLPPHYVSREQVTYYEDLESQQLGGVWQPDVYEFADRLAQRLGCQRLIDLGCGNGQKLASFSERYETVGVDFGGNIDTAKTSFPSLNWIEHDFSNALEFSNLFEESSLFICSDVVEHLLNPVQLLDQISNILSDSFGIVISTPDRDRARGPENLGPPENPAHTMEWNFEEFYSLLASRGLRPLLHGFTRNFSLSDTRNTQVAFIPGGLSYLNLPPNQISLLAIIPCFNEVDIVEKTIERLLGQGCWVHVIDNWSMDGSWELLVERFQSNNRVSLERFPEHPTDQYQWFDMLSHIDSVGRKSRHDWIMHVDADEVFESFRHDWTLRECIGLADAAGFDVVDLTLIDFRPTSSFLSRDYVLDNYALPKMWQFATRPGAKSLERIWKKTSELAGIAQSGGHLVTRSKKVFPINLILRHYPIRNPNQGKQKIFRDRLPRFELEKSRYGWHSHYDAFDEKMQFVWEESAVLPWNWNTPSEFVVEFTTRGGITFESIGLPGGVF